jgi:hypothetical protein
MKNLMSWAQYIATQILIFSCLYAWKIEGIEGAGNLLQALLWLFAATGIVLAFAAARGARPPRSELRKAAATCNTLILLAVLCWFGHMALAAFYMLGILGSAVYRNRFDAEGNPIPPNSSKQPSTDTSSHGCKP